LIASSHAGRIESLREKGVGELAIGQHVNALGVCRGGGLVRDHDDGHGAGGIADKFFQQPPEFGGVGRIQIATGFVGKEDGRREEHGSGDGDALLLTTRERIGAVGGTVGEAQEREELFGAAAEFGKWFASEEAGEFDVF
jgi:hypothetical protein